MDINKLKEQAKTTWEKVETLEGEAEMLRDEANQVQRMAEQLTKEGERLDREIDAAKRRMHGHRAWMQGELSKFEHGGRWWLTNGHAAAVVDGEPDVKKMERFDGSAHIGKLALLGSVEPKREGKGEDYGCGPDKEATKVIEGRRFQHKYVELIEGLGELRVVSPSEGEVVLIAMKGEAIVGAVMPLRSV